LRKTIRLLAHSLRPSQHIDLVAQSEGLQLHSGPSPEGGTGGGQINRETNRLNMGTRACQRNRANIN